MADNNPFDPLSLNLFIPNTGVGVQATDNGQMVTTTVPNVAPPEIKVEDLSDLVPDISQAMEEKPIPKRKNICPLCGEVH